MKQTDIILQHLGIGYRKKRHLHMVAEDLCAHLQCGQLTCLAGANGTGKSTLLKTMAGFLPPLAGEIIIREKEEDGEERQETLDRLSPRQLARKISVVLTSGGEAFNLTAEETIALGRSPYTGFWGTLAPQDRAVVEEAMQQTGIANLRNRAVLSLSDGERQKVMIAKALAQQTPIIYLDEPTAFLDYPSKVELLQLLSHLTHDLGKTILFSTHDMELALQLADRIWLMQDTGALITGTPRGLADNGALAHFLERPGISFDKEQLAVKVERHQKDI